MWIVAPVLVAALGLAGGTLAAVRGRSGRSFTATTVAIVAVAVTLFGSLYPDVLPSTTDPAFSLTVVNAASTPYTLTIMTWVAAVVTPVVLAYQAWTFWVFRRRLTREDVVDAAH
ncbi:Cytochrome bd-I ubiquinol oxidase subunit 2 [Pseudonocardia autotrophica]|nr:Cytochrome bd-I ubiquinol oxidase subunit 2 [Pseudonocardia autotrophica]